MVQEPVMDIRRQEEIIEILKETGSPDPQHDSLYAAAQSYIHEGTGSRESVFASGMRRIAHSEEQHGSLSRDEIVQVFTQGVEGIMQANRDYVRAVRQAKICAGMNVG